MCMLSKPVLRVAETSILVARAAPRGTGETGARVIVAYQCKVEQKNDNFMLLAVPNPDSIELIDLSAHKTLLGDLEKGFVYHGPKPGGGSALAMSTPVRKSIQVVRVGSYRCSVARNIADLARIDTEQLGTLPPGLVALLQRTYGGRNIGYVVARLDAAINGTYEPLCYSYISPDGTALMPTLHYHKHADGTEDTDTADWDHTLLLADCAWPDAETGRDYEWRGPMPDSARRALDFLGVTGHTLLMTRKMGSNYPNKDLTVLV